MFTKVGKVLIDMDLNEGITVKIKGPDYYYFVEVLEYFGNDAQPRVLESYHIAGSKNNFRRHFKLPIQFHIDFEINVYKYDKNYGLVKLMSHRQNLQDKLIKFEINTEDRNESILWLESVKRFCDKNGCIPLVETKFDDINKSFESYYWEKGLTTYKTYRIGRYPKSSNDWRTVDPRHEGKIWFGAYKTFWSYQNPRDYNQLNPQEVVDDILGIN